MNIDQCLRLLHAANKNVIPDGIISGIKDDPCRTFLSGFEAILDMAKANAIAIPDVMTGILLGITLASASDDDRFEAIVSSLEDVNAEKEQEAKTKVRVKARAPAEAYVFWDPKISSPG